MYLEDILKLQANDEIYLLEDFNDALIGVLELAGEYVALYNKASIIYILQERDGMDEIEAEEYYDYNIMYSHSSDKAPRFALLLDQK